MTDEKVVDKGAIETVYVNQVSLIATATDMTVIFGRIAMNIAQIKRTAAGGPPATAAPAPIKIMSSVTLSIGTAKDLVAIMTDAITRHEATFGAVASPYLLAQQAAKQNHG